MHFPIRPLAILFFLGCATAARTAEPSAAVATPAWMQLDSHQVEKGKLVSIYSSVEGDCLDRLRVNWSWLQRLAKPQDFHFDAKCPGGESSQPSLEGRWEFQDPGPAVPPATAIRTTFPGDGSSYKAKVEVYCEADDEACRAQLASAAKMRAPAPPEPLTNAAWDQWLVLVAAESCTPGPAHRDPPDYPMEQVADGVTGTTVVLILVNRCGESRAVVVEKSSRDRALDRAAVEAARKWRVELPTDYLSSDPNRPQWVRIPVDFNL